MVAPGGTYSARLAFEGVPGDGSVRVRIHQRVRSRSELAQSMEGEQLRSDVLDVPVAISSLPPQADGSRQLSLGHPLRTEGVYPMELIAQDAAGEPLATLVTHLIVPPEEGDDSPPLGVAVVAEIGAPPALQPDGTAALPPSTVADLTALVSGVLAVPDVPLTLAVTPETVDALTTSTAPGDAALVDALRRAAAGRTVMALPYAAVSPDDLATVDLVSELAQQRERGRAVLADVLGVGPTSTPWLSPPNLGASGLGALAFGGINRFVVSDAQVEPLEPGIISYSLAQPFLLTVPEGTPPDQPSPEGIQALATDPGVLERLDTPGAPGLVASRVLSELALLRLEQPSVARSVVLPIRAGVPAAVVQLILEGLGAGRPFAPLDLDAAFDHATPLLDGGGNPVDRRLLATTTEPIRADVAASIIDARAHLDTFVSLVDGDNPLISPLERHLLVATAADLTNGERRDHVDAVESAIQGITGKVSTPATFTLTLTAREGTIPLTIRNDSGVPLRVSIRLRSQKLEFPEGDTIDRLLTEETTRIDIAVRSPRRPGPSRCGSTSAPRTAPRACRCRSTRCGPPRCPAPAWCSRWARACSSWCGGLAIGDAPGAAPSSSPPPATRRLGGRSRRAARTRFRRHGRSPHRHRQQLRSHR